MVPNDDKISSIQLGVFIYLSIIGVGILTLPASIVKGVQNDAWILVIVSGIINGLFIYIMCSIGKKYGDLGFVETLKLLFGKVLGIIFSIPVFIYFLFIASFELRTFADTTKMYLLNKTPLEFIILPLILLAFMLSRRGIEAIVRFFEISIPIVAVVIVILIIIILPKSDYSNLRPFFTAPIKEYISTFPSSIFAYSGFELLLIAFPFIRNKKEACKASLTALVLVGILYTIVVIQCIARLGVEETKTLIYPTMALIKASDVPGAFIERIEGLLMSIWVVFIYTTLVSYMYGAAVVGADILKHKEKNHILCIVLPILYIVALQGDSIVDVLEIAKNMIYFQYYTMIVLPIIMFIMSKIKKKAGNVGVKK